MSMQTIGGMSTTTLAIVAGGAYILTRKGKKGLNTKTLQRQFERTKIVGKTAAGLGVGVLINFFDKKVTKGALTKMGVALPFKINNQPVNLNLTDAITAAATFGLSMNKAGLMSSGVVVAAKKAGEAYNLIDPPGFGGPSMYGNYPASLVSSYGFGSSAGSATRVSQTP